MTGLPAGAGRVLAGSPCQGSIRTGMQCRLCLALSLALLALAPGSRAQQPGTAPASPYGGRGAPSPYGGTGQPALTRVPDLTGKTQPEALVALRLAGLQAEFRGVADGRAAGQLPAAGSQVPRNSSVLVTLDPVLAVTPSDAPTPSTATTQPAQPPVQPPAQPLVISLARVPDVAGKEKADAQSTLRQAGLQPEFRGAEEGRAIAQLPVAGSEVAPGSTVQVTLRPPVPPTPARVLVPDVSDLSLAEAGSILRAAHLTAEALSGPSSGRVGRQVPAAGMLVARGTEVDLFLIDTPTPWFARVPSWTWLLAATLLAGGKLLFSRPSPHPAPHPAVPALRPVPDSGRVRLEPRAGPVIRSTVTLRTRFGPVAVYLRETPLDLRTGKRHL